LATAPVLGACARECIVNWRRRGQYRYCDKSEEKAVKPQLSYFRAPVRFTDIVLCGEHFNTSWTKPRNGLTASPDNADRWPHFAQLAGTVLYPARLVRMPSSPKPGRQPP
jgi:hypothetical protein